MALASYNSFWGLTKAIYMVFIDMGVKIHLKYRIVINFLQFLSLVWLTIINLNNIVYLCVLASMWFL